MSLKGFHLLFVAISTLMAFGLGIWSLLRFMDGNGLMNGALTLVSIGGGVLLVWYGIHIRRKLHTLGISWDIHHIAKY
jgi:hypothetical protein